MGAGTPRSTLWARAISDEAFRDALIVDPLRALAGAPGVSATPEEIAQLEDMSEEERRDLVRRLLEEAMRRRVRRMWGDHFWTADDPRPPSDAGGS